MSCFLKIKNVTKRDIKKELFKFNLFIEPKQLLVKIMLSFIHINIGSQTEET